MIRRLHLVTAITAGLVAAGLMIATFLVPGTSVPEVAVVVVFALVFPIMGAAVARFAFTYQVGRTHGWHERRRQTSRLICRGLRQSLPLELVTMLGVICIFSWLVMMLSISRIPGQPERQGNHYFANNHGTHIPLTKVEYERDLDLQYRIFAAGATAFYAVTVGLVLAKPGAIPAGRT